MDEFLKIQLEYARKLRLHQDLLRFAIPAAYFTFVGAAAKIFADVTLGTWAWLGFAVIGFIIYVVTISEHFFYAAFRNWERHLEALVLNPDYRPELTNEGTAISPVNANLTDSTHTVGRIELRLFSSARKLRDVSQPNLAHPTMFAVLLGIALSVGIYVYQSASALFPVDPSIAEACGIIVVGIQLLVLKYYHLFYRIVVVRFLELLATK